MAAGPDDYDIHEIFDGIMRDKIAGRVEELNGDDLIRVWAFVNSDRNISGPFPV